MRLFYQPSIVKEAQPLFIEPKPEPIPTVLFNTARVININASISKNKVFLEWIVSENESAAQFEVEKSIDGKNFIMTALVFGTDKIASDTYQFYEKKGNSKVQYRIKIINKNQTVEYSSAIEINPNT
ncbi:MAG: hypothetical protein ABIU11_01310 [Chitinophagaceae bacterium]